MQERDRETGRREPSERIETRYWCADDTTPGVTHWACRAIHFETGEPISIPSASVGQKGAEGQGLKTPLLVRFFPANDPQDAINKVGEAAAINKICKLHGRELPARVPRGDSFKAVVLRDGKSYAMVLSTEKDWQVARLKAQAHDPENVDVLDAQAERLGWGSLAETVTEVEWAREARKREEREKRELFERQMRARKGRSSEKPVDK